MIARLRGQPQKLRQLRPDLPEGLESALARAMDANADARYNTALELAAALTASPLQRLPVEDQGEAEIRRFPAFDPPEYVEWKPDPALVRGFRETIERNPERAAVVARLPVTTKLACTPDCCARGCTTSSSSGGCARVSFPGMARDR